MIASWMLSTLLFTALLGVAAHFGEIALRVSGRQARWPWLFAIGAAVIWPVLSPFVPRTATDAVAGRPSMLPGIRIVPDVLPAFTRNPSLDDVLVVLWVLASAGALVRLARAMFACTFLSRDQKPTCRNPRMFRECRPTGRSGLACADHK